ncbi:Glycosyl hydrolases family 43 [Phycisphaerae bacterium RAS1]|nr:Glycosyl hydrolases family 43 [Phycisphaerae bacterium RAS1]
MALSVPVWLSVLAVSICLAGCATTPHATTSHDSQAESPATLIPTTYCNPLNIDYAYSPIPEAIAQARHRATADPVIVPFRGDYYLFSTNQWGYWWSHDLIRWTCVPRRFLKPEHDVHDDLCAPAAWVMNDALYLIGSTEKPNFPIYASRDPRAGVWDEAVAAFELPAWDPAFFLDDDGRLYLYYGSSNATPIYGIEVDRRSLKPIGERRELIRLDDTIHGWERFGEAHDNTFLRPFIEGAWMTKQGGRYYLQYGAPGTEFSSYADGVYVGDHPLGPFTYQPHNPFSMKAGGFARGAGHGSTFPDQYGNWWHTATIAISVKNNFERRLGLWPAGFDGDGVLFCNTAYGDFPQRIPAGRFAAAAGTSTGWMLLNYAKPVQTSSTLGGFAPNFAVDEDIKTHWSAQTGGPGEWLQSDLGAVCTVRAMQVNYADQDAEFTSRTPGLYHCYKLFASADGAAWELMVDKSANRTDVPHDYVELPRPVEARYVRIENIHVPTGKFALSGLRIFGLGHGRKPAPVRHFTVLRGESERRNAWLKWFASDDATGYVIYTGTSPDKLYTSLMVFGANEVYFRAMDRDRPYYFQIEAFNENGSSSRTSLVKVD